MKGLKITKKIYTCDVVLARYKLSNSNDIWHMYCMTPADKNRLC